MSQLLSSADESMSSKVKRLQRFCYRSDKKFMCILLSLMLFNANVFCLYLYYAGAANSAPVGTLPPLETIYTFDHVSLHWLNDPRQQALLFPDPSGESPGSGGGCTVTPEELTLAPPAFRDFWSRTFYSPTLVKHDASALLRTVPYEVECTVALDFEVTPKTQFDQVQTIDIMHHASAVINHGSRLLVIALLCVSAYVCIYNVRMHVTRAGWTDGIH
jgi:hypothetical protein